MPKLYLIPVGDWYCPKCENDQLLTKLRFEFENYVSNLAKREREQLRKQRLKYVEINVGNILTEESTYRKNKSNKKKYGDYASDLDDSELEEEDDLDEDNSSNEDLDTENSDSNYRSRKKYSNNNSSGSNRKRNTLNTYSKRKPVEYRRPEQKQRKRRRSYTDESGSNSSNGLNSSLSSEDDGDRSSTSSLPKQRTARKKVSYQFKEYDDLINSAIQESDYDEYAENEEEEVENEEEEVENEEDSDNGKSPYSKGKDISNLMLMAGAENPFEDKKSEIKQEDVIVNKIDNIVQDDLEKQQENKNQLIMDNKETDNQQSQELEDERKVIISEKKGKQKLKRKLNDLDSPVEEAENDSDFTIKDESVTELEEDTEAEEINSNDYSDQTEDNDTDLSDWARNTRKHNTRTGGRRNKRSKKSKKRNKRSRRYDSSDNESDYGYQTRRISKRVTYKEASTTDEEEEDDYSDNSEKYKKKKKSSSSSGSKKKKRKESTDELDSEDERTVIKKSSKRSIKSFSSEEEEDDGRKSFVSSEEEGKRKSKRAQKKKVYDDFTDIDESEEEKEQQPINDEDAKELNKSVTKNDDQQVTNEKEISNELKEDEKLNLITLPQAEKQSTQIDLPNKDEISFINKSEQSLSIADDVQQQIKKTPKVKIKITKPNPKLSKNKDLNNSLESSSTIDLQPSIISTSSSQINLMPNAQNVDLNSTIIINNNLPNLILQQQLQLQQQSSIPITSIDYSQLSTLPIDTQVQKKKRGRQPKNPQNETSTKDLNTPPAKRGRKPKSSLIDQDLININATVAAATTSNTSASTKTNSALSQLTQFANDIRLDPINNKLLPNSANQSLVSTLDSVNIKQLLNSNAQISQLANKNLTFPNQLLNPESSSIIAGQATILNNSNDKSKCVFNLKFRKSV